MPNNYEISDTNNNELVTEYIEDDVVAYSEALLEDVNKINLNETIKVPIAQLITLGAGFSSLIPALRTVTQTTTVNTNGLFRLANAAVGDTLKQAKMVIFGALLKHQRENLNLYSYKMLDHLVKQAQECDRLIQLQ